MAYQLSPLPFVDRPVQMVQNAPPLDIAGVGASVLAGYQSGREGKARRAFKKEFKDAVGVKPSDQEIKDAGHQPGNIFTDYFRALTRTPGVKAAGANPLFEEQQRGLQLRNEGQEIENKAGRMESEFDTQLFKSLRPPDDGSLNSQLQRDHRNLIDEFGALKSTEDRLNWLKNNSALNLTDRGRQVLGHLSDITKQMQQVEGPSEQALIAIARKKAAVERMEHEIKLEQYGFNPAQPETRASAEKNFQLLERLAPFADKMGVLLEDIDDSWFDAATGVADLSKALPALSKMKRQGNQGQITPLDQARFDIAKGNLQLREREIALREEALKLRNQGVNRAEFIDQQLRALSRSVLGATLTEQELKEAAERYGRIYDSTIGQSGSTPGPASNDPTDPVGLYQDEPLP